MKSICLRWSRSMIMPPPQIKFLRRLLKNQPFFLPLCVFRQNRCSSRCFWMRRSVSCQRVNSEREDSGGELGQGRSMAYFSLRGVVARISPVGMGGTPSEGGCLWAVLSSDSDESCALAGRPVPPASPSSAKCIFFLTLSIPLHSSSSSVPGGRFLLVLRRKEVANGAKRGAMWVGGWRCIRYEYMALEFEWVICPDSNSLFAPNRIPRKEPTRPHWKISPGGMEEWNGYLYGLMI